MPFSSLFLLTLQGRQESQLRTLLPPNYPVFSEAAASMLYCYRIEI